MHESLHMILRLQLYTAGLYYRYNSTNLISALIVLFKSGQPNNEIECIYQETTNSTQNLFVLKSVCKCQKLAQICVYIIKINLAETLVFRKMQSSFADRLRRCSHLCLISLT